MKAIIKKILKPLYYFIRYEVGGVFISLGMVKKYRRIMNMKGKYSTKKCFLIGSGPSLLIDDLQRLSKSDYVTFGCNSMFKAYDLCDWRADMYCVSDAGVYDSVGDQIIRKQEDKPIFVTNIIYDRIKNKNEKGMLIPVRVKRNLDYPSVRRFSKHLEKYSYPAGSVLYFMIQVAVYLGFKEIYLLGCDCNYSITKQSDGKLLKTGDKDYFIPGYEDRKNHQPINQYDIVMPDYEAARVYCDKNEIKIFNATRGGKLESFERIDFDDVVKV